MRRLNGILVALAALAVLAVVGWNMGGRYLFGTRYVTDVVAVGTADEAPPPEVLSLGSLSLVDGGPVARADLISSQDYRQDSYDKSTSGNRRNVVFLAPDAAPRWLFPAGERLILWDWTLERPDLSRQTGRRALGLLVLSVDADASGDGRLSAEDPQTLRIGTADGRELAVLAEGLTETPDVAIGVTEAVLLLTREGRAAEVMRLDLATRRPVEITEVPLP